MQMSVMSLDNSVVVCVDDQEFPIDKTTKSYIMTMIKELDWEGFCHKTWIIWIIKWLD